MENTKEDLETLRYKVPWIPIVLIIGISSFAGSALYCLLTPSGSVMQCSYNWGTGVGTKFTILAFALITFAYPLRKILKISAIHLNYIYAAGTTICYNIFSNEMATPIGISRSVLFTPQPIREMMGTWWWMPSYETIDTMMAGGSPVNWGAWAGSIVFFTTFSYCLFIFTSGLSLVFRRRWIDIENIPFPLTIAANEVVKTVDVNRSADRKVRPFVIGLILGILFELPIFLQALYPWFPDIYMWRVDTCPSGVWRAPASEASPLAQIVGLAMVSKSPVWFGLFFLAPLSVSFNVWFWSLVMMILEQIAFSMGYYTGITAQGGCCRVLGLGGGASLTQGAPFYWGYMSTIGGTMAITAMMLYSSRGYLRQTIRQALSRKAEHVEEGTDVVSYRCAYTILMVGAISIILWLMSAGIDLLSAFFILIFSIFIGGIAGFYTYSHTGFYAANNLRGGHSWFPLLLRWGGTLPDMSPNLRMSDWTTQEFTNGNVLLVFPTAQMMAFKMASLTGASNRNTFLVCVAAILVSTPIIIMTRIWITQIYGAKVVWGGTSSFENCCTGMQWVAPLPLFVEYGAIGFVITFAFAILHARFVWFPFEPIGFLIATSVAGNWYGVWFAFLVSWLLKTIVLRVGGSKIYEKYGVPVVGGFLAGDVIVIIIGSLVLTLRFFVPF
jgi:hypothetical protein